MALKIYQEYEHYNHFNKSNSLIFLELRNGVKTNLKNKVQFISETGGSSLMKLAGLVKFV